MRRFTTEELVASRPDRGQMDACRLPVTVVLDNIRSGQNVGLIFRTLDCAGAEQLILAGITPYPTLNEHCAHQIGKTAVGGSLETIPWKYEPSVISAIENLKARGYQIVVAEQCDSSVYYTKPTYKFPVAIILGHEREGVSDAVLKLADLVIELPVRGITNSLNVAQTTAILTYHMLELWDPDSTKSPLIASSISKPTSL